MAAYVGAMLVVSLLACAREPNQITFPPAISSEQGKFLEVRESGATVQVEHFRAANENAKVKVPCFRTALLEADVNHPESAAQPTPHAASIF